MKNIWTKKQYILAMAAIVYHKYGLYTKAYHLIRDCLNYDMRYRFNSNWLRINLKRLGFGIQPQQGEVIDIGENGWKITHLPGNTYKRQTVDESEYFISHHHTNGAAFEIRPNSPWKEQRVCIGCKEEVPKQVLIWIDLIKLRKAL